ncbi:hypothetical protein CPB83DRAFT_860008 [Crepidotus variabilis]|uniref:F-box domain-containing protein n=1 Tax=Crepidotus variabilis TaxID=179855 RepID=A0A9P6E9R8_9AGAR|nr:hypothetical protein CPB83DRAFT_860008 [Crepidotus variabilis]
MASPISNLPPDVLYTIFHLNATLDRILDKPKKPPIELWPTSPQRTTLNSSRVCQTWRQLLLESTTIWGRLFDFDLICLYPPLLDLLESRSASSPLWVFGEEYVDLNTDDQPPESRKLTRNAIMIWFLKHEWDRVQHLVVGYKSPQYAEKLLEVGMFKPSPALQHFELRGPIRTNDQALFANSAPSLRSYECTVFQLDFTTPWFRQLHTLSIFLPRTVLNDFLKALSELTNLRILTIYAVINQPPPNFDDDYHHLSRIGLHRIQQLLIKGSLPLTTYVLASLELPKDCCTCIIALAHRLGPPGTNFQAIAFTMPRLAELASSYTNLNLLPSLRWLISPTKFTFIRKHFSESSNHESIFRPNGFGFTFWGRLSYATPFADVPADMLTNVTHMDLEVETQHDPSFRQRLARSQITERLQLLSTVTDLTINEEGLEWLVGLDMPLFPTLKILKLKCRNEFVDSDSAFQYKISRMLFDLSPTQIVSSRQ